MRQDTDANNLETFWQQHVDWEAVKAALGRYAQIGKLIDFEELRYPKHGRGAQWYGVHPLARELACDNFDKQIGQLEKSLVTVAELDGGKARAEKLGSLGNPSVEYWSWLSEIETGCLLHSLGFQVQFTSDVNATDLIVSVSGQDLCCEVKATLKQELGFFELRQLLGSTFADKYYFHVIRSEFTALPKTPPSRVWCDYQHVLAHCKTGHSPSGPTVLNDEQGASYRVLTLDNQSERKYCYVDPYDDGCPKETLQIRLCEVMKEKTNQLTRQQPSVLVLCLIHDRQLIKAICKVGKRWQPDWEEHTVPSCVVLYDNGRCPPAVMGTWCHPNSSEASIKDFAQRLNGL